MRKLLGITLGIMTALGGFVDLGQIVFTTQAGALFGYKLLWVIVLGTVGIIVYMEMCGRVAVVAQKPVFCVVRTGLGKKLGLATLVASNLLNLITCAAEIGGVAEILHLLTGWPEKALLVGSCIAIAAFVHLVSFQRIERVFGLSGLLMIVFAVSAFHLHPDWQAVGRGLAPIVSLHGSRNTLLYAFFAVGIFSAMLMEYEVHFYSSGALEEDWKPSDLGENFMVASLGSILGSVLTIALMILGAILFLPRHIFPELLSTTIMAGAFPFGKKALVIALLGALVCIGGAAIETALSGAYNVCQFYNFDWGKNRRAKDVPVFTIVWVGMLGLALIIALTGVHPLELVNISIIFGMVVMPLTYYPILRAASKKSVMGKHANTRFVTAVGTLFLVLITAAAIAAIPLMFLTKSGKP
ncbi:MAG: NRAMP family divalent metal transporter [Candidatus Acidiferrales bacterium]